MIQAYRSGPAGLVRIEPSELASAVWIDLMRPTDAEMAEVARFGVEVPSLSDMEEIEVSNRLYHEDGAEYLTVVLPGASDTHKAISGPVTFILQRERLITVRHHAPRPFETYPPRADKAASGCNGPDAVFLGLTEEITGRLADLLEGVGRALDEVTRDVFDETAASDNRLLQGALTRTGRQGDLIARVRVGLVTLERAMSYFAATLKSRDNGKTLDPVVKAQLRDMQALEVHADFLGSRLSLAVDATLGMVNLGQNVTLRILSLVPVLFLPPTLIASIYGMNFEHIPELHSAYGYPIALCAMLASAVGTYLFFKWRGWL